MQTESITTLELLKVLKKASVSDANVSLKRKVHEYLNFLSNIKLISTLYVCTYTKLNTLFDEYNTKSLHTYIGYPADMSS
jgi:hypothetical protein